MTTTDFFYRDLPESHAIENVFDLNYSRIVPMDWLLLMTDVVQSTQAIEAGRYKDVNIAGGLAVMAIANLVGSMDFPFIFGGDGVTMLIPSYLETAARAILIDTRNKIASALDLQLRIAIIPLSSLYNQGYQLRVAKLRLSAYYAQAMIDGDALDIAESWLKSSAINNPYLITETNTLLQADFSGFTCRWQDIPSVKGEVLSLIIKFRSQNTALRTQELNTLLDFISSCYGSEQDYHPIQIQQMHSGGFKQLKHEIKIRSAGYSWFCRQKIALTIVLEFTALRILQLLHIPLSFHWFNILRLKEMNVISSDFRKFDGALKMIISGSTESRQQLTRYLQTAYQQQRLFYGMHVSDRALLTCLMHINSQSEVHFVDGAEGGYAIAAKQLKAQLLAEN